MKAPVRPRKRRRQDSEGGASIGDSGINAPQQLVGLLRFSQDPTLLMHGLRSFYLFLETCNKGPDASNNAGGPTTLSLLCDYLKDVRRREDEGDDVSMPDMMQTWSFASETNDDLLLLAVPSTLTLLLKTLSGKIQCRDEGLQLCKTLLSTPQLRLLARGLSASLSKQRAISACLQLLTEVVLFDGGVYAKRVYANRELSFRSLDRNITLRTPPAAGMAEDPSHVSVRRDAVEFLLANFALQNTSNKVDLIGHRNLISGLFKDIKNDSGDLAVKILDVLKRHIILDEKLPRGVKGNFFSEWVLGRIATLYNHGQTTLLPSADNPARLQAHSLLMLVCTSSNIGVLIPNTGWYSSMMDQSAPYRHVQTSEVDIIDLEGQMTGLSSVEEVRIRNRRLAAFAQHLRPYSDGLQSELLLEIFRAAPELVPGYFLQKRSFSFDPKLSATWVGYCAFLFQVIQLPVVQPPADRGGKLDSPPPANVVIESVLPLPLTQKVLTRCLNQKSPLISHLAVHLLIAAFRKLALVIAAISPPVSLLSVGPWRKCSRELVREFCRRCPRMKDVISVLRGLPETQVLQREATSRLLAMYYKVIPQIALDEIYDISGSLSLALNRVVLPAAKGNPSVQLLELEHVLAVAQRSPSMRWTHKPDNLQFSPFISLIKLLSASPNGPLTEPIEALLQSAIRETHMLQDKTPTPALHALLACFRAGSSTLGTPTSSYEFFDNVVSRFVKRPVFYEDRIAALSDETMLSERSHPAGPISPLMLAIVEQWLYFAKTETVNAMDKEATAVMVGAFLRHCKLIGEDPNLLMLLCERLAAASQGCAWELVFRSALAEGHTLLVRATPSQDADSTEQSHTDISPKGLPGLTSEFDEEKPMLLPSSKFLSKWANKDLQEAIEDGDVSKLILCLCSETVSIRLQALASLNSLVNKLGQSSYIEREMVVLLLQETIHTAKDIVHGKPFPTYLGVFASQAAQVEADPQHFLYSKLNRFLHEGPVWASDKVPMVRSILHHPPDDNSDDSSTSSNEAELNWFLNMVLDGLRTAEDLNVYRRGAVFERCLALYPFLHMSENPRNLTIRLIRRASIIPGGGATLITRLGILSWISARWALNDLDSVTCEILVSWLTSAPEDRQKVEAWSGGDVPSHARS